MHTRSKEIKYLEKLMLNAPIFYHINGFSKYKMNINPAVLKNLTIQQQQQMLRFISEPEHNLMFDSGARHMFSLSNIMMRRLISLNPSTTNNKNKLIEIYRHFLMRCSGKFGRLISSQFLNRGRSQQIPPPSEIIQLLNSNSLQKRLMSISHYGYAALLGNTGAIAEMVLRLSKIYVSSRFKKQLLEFIEYGISRRCPDCLAVMAYFLDVGLGIVPIDRQRALKLAGESAEAGSFIGWEVLASLLEFNDLNQDPYDGVYVDETAAGVRLFVRERATHNVQFLRMLKESCCKSCLNQFSNGNDVCQDCGLEFGLFIFNYYPDDDTVVSKHEQLRIAIEIYYKILIENPFSHSICVDVRKNLINIYKKRRQLFGGSVEATDEEIRRLEAI